MQNSSEGFAGDVKPWQRVLGLVLFASLGISALYDSNFQGFATMVNPGIDSIGGLEGPAGTTFTDVTAQAGLDFTRTAWGTAVPFAEIIGGGVGVADVDLDGDEDVFVTGGRDQPNALFLNNGDLTFTEATAAWGLDGEIGPCQGVAFGDYDGDGRPDLAVGCVGALHVYRNEGTAFALLPAEEAGLEAGGACPTDVCLPSSLGWLDIENDGDLDLYVVNYVDPSDGNGLSAGKFFPYLVMSPAQPARLFVHEDGVFVERAEAAGVQNPGGKGLGVTMADFDGDGYTDIYVANDITPNRLFQNQGDGTFRDIARGTDAAEAKSSMGTTAADLDNDGDLDLLVTNLQGHEVSLLRAEDGVFEYATRDAMLRTSGRSTGWGITTFDYDLDGRIDFHQSAGPFFNPRRPDFRDLMFRNLGDGTFADVTATAGQIVDEAVTRGAVAFDVDQDGDEDLVLMDTFGGGPRLLVNGLDNGHGSLQLRLQGQTANRDGIGALVTVERTDGLRLVQPVASACSFQSSCSPWLTFGLAAAQVASVEVRWPGGETETFGSLEAGRHVLSQGSGS